MYVTVISTLYFIHHLSKILLKNGRINLFLLVPGGMGVTSAWSPLGNCIEGQAHPNVFAFLQFLSNRGFSIFCVVKFLSHVFFCVCFPVVQGFSPRLLCLFSNNFSVQILYIFFIYSYLYIFYIFFYRTVGSLICAG